MPFRRRGPIVLTAFNHVLACIQVDLGITFRNALPSLDGPFMPNPTHTACIATTLEDELRIGMEAGVVRSSLDAWAN
ncbi:MAG TPA: hypothetical protein VJ755_06270 [Gemmatimonadales bacterium]|nr:hypothetical protein [Gemmatimonadales bacterium]